MDTCTFKLLLTNISRSGNEINFETRASKFLVRSGAKEKEKSVEKIIATVLEGKKRDAHNIEFKGIFL